MKQLFLIAVIALLFTNLFAAELGRDTMQISKGDWKVWLDEKAEYKKDELYITFDQDVPDYSNLPENEPTNGWGTLDYEGIPCELPASIEEYFSEGNNTYRYHGVSWFWREIEIPADWEGKTVRILVEKARLRAELYVNGKLAGYDIVAETPFGFDITKFLEPGKKNQIAFRLTNPGGSRGWQDFPAIPWDGGEQIAKNNDAIGIDGGKMTISEYEWQLPNSHDFSGIGHVELVATDLVYITDVFVKNLLPANEGKLKVATSIFSSYWEWDSKPVDLTLTIIDLQTNEVVKTETRKFASFTGHHDLNVLTQVNNPKLWSPDEPNLYKCKINLNSKTFKDEYEVRFGFRYLEVKELASGDHHMFLNGKRFRIRSAIDFGYYAFTGFYATDEMAQNSVKAAKAIGHNGINCHRRIGEPLILKYADEMGIVTWDEPGGFRDGNDFAKKISVENVKRMVKRDRNHPSMMVYCLMNEGNQWDWAREEALKAASDLDGTRLVINTSGSQFPEDMEHERRFKIPHIRPYQTEMRYDFLDIHNAANTGARFPETDFFGIQRNNIPDRLFFAGEVISSVGPRNWVKTYELNKRMGNLADGFGKNIYEENYHKQTKAFEEWNLASVGSKNIKDAGDISVQAGRGQMYMHGRHTQVALINNTIDLSAINAWSPGPMTTGSGWDWDSGLTDEARNLKGPAEDYALFSKTLQLAIMRDNSMYAESEVEKAKYLHVGDTAHFELHLVNEGLLKEGTYKLQIKVTDGAGTETEFSEKRKVSVLGGDVYAQQFQNITVPMLSSYKGGYITVEAKILNKQKLEVIGKEQVLLQNRASFAADLRGLKGSVFDWDGAKEALNDAGVNMVALDQNPNFIVLGDSSTTNIDNALNLVKNEGAVLVINFSEYWANVLYNKSILNQKVTEWGGRQVGTWFGNGWGYLDHFIGNQAVPSASTIGTNGWEVPADPKGFYPFSSDYKMGAYGLHVARPWISEKEPENYDEKQMPMPTLSVLLGTIDYGKGKIVLHPGYDVSEKTPFNDMLFYNIISMGSKNNW